MKSWLIIRWKWLKLLWMICMVRTLGLMRESLDRFRINILFEFLFMVRVRINFLMLLILIMMSFMKLNLNFTLNMIILNLYGLMICWSLMMILIFCLFVFKVQTLIIVIFILHNYIEHLHWLWRLGLICKRLSKIRTFLILLFFWLFRVHIHILIVFLFCETFLLLFRLLSVWDIFIFVFWS